MSEEITKKQCRKCGRLLVLSSFYEHPGGWLGRRSACKDCMAKSFKQWSKLGPIGEGRNPKERRMAEKLLRSGASIAETAKRTGLSIVSVVSVKNSMRNRK